MTPTISDLKGDPPPPPPRSYLRCILCVVIGLIVGLLIGHMITYHWAERHFGRSTAFSTPYQAVVLSNGAVFYGKLTGYNSRHPELTDVFYIVSKTDPNTKQVSNILVKRGKELHSPDRMYLNPQQIVFVEPVGTSSKVAQLINESNR
jgi:hypothetical protein